MNQVRILLREKAVFLRKQGKTYGEISKILGVVPKGTLSYWLSDVLLSKKSKLRIVAKQTKDLKKAHLASVAALRQRQRDVTTKLKSSLQHLKAKVTDTDFLKVALAFLYLGEGSKGTSKRGLQLGNSDTLIVKLYINFLKVCYGIDKANLHCYICYRADQSIQALTSYWVKVTGIPRKNFYPSKPDPRTVGKPTKNKTYRGVCVVSGGSTIVQEELALIPEIFSEGL